VSVLGKLWVKGTAVSIMSGVSFSLSMSTISGLLKYKVLLIVIDLS
jgi:hypothetical protein